LGQKGFQGNENGKTEKQRGHAFWAWKRETTSDAPKHKPILKGEGIF